MSRTIGVALLLFAFLVPAALQGQATCAFNIDTRTCSGTCTNGGVCHSTGFATGCSCDIPVSPTLSPVAMTLLTLGLAAFGYRFLRKRASL